jgi:hypothetical protein
MSPCVLQVGVKTENTHVKKADVENCSKIGAEESVSSEDKKPIIKEEEGEEEKQDIEGSHIKEGDKLDKNIKETLSEKSVHSFFGKCSNYHLSKQLHVIVIYSGGTQFKYSGSCSVVFLSLFNRHSDSSYRHIKLNSYNWLVTFLGMVACM